jgi:DNA-binding NarL/FixJ family response regulator
VTRVRILIADDQSVVRRGLRSLLESHQDWEVCGEAVNGRQAVEEAIRLRPDVVVLDIRMPELNGLEATGQIRKALPGTEVLIFTAHASEELACQGLRSGARGFLLKSDADDVLIGAVGSLSRHKIFVSPRVSQIVLENYIGSASRMKQTEPYIDRTTPREREIIQLVAEGRSNKEVAAILGMSVRTVENHRAHIMEKLSLHSTSELVRYAIRNHVIEP